MTAADVQWGEQDILVQGLNERIDARVLPDGQLVEVLNGEYKRSGRISKRPGCERKLTPPASITHADALARHDQELLVLDGLGDFGDGNYPALLTINESAASFNKADRAPNAALRMWPADTDSYSSITSDMAITYNGLAIYGIATSDNTPIVRVRNMRTRAIEKEVAMGVGGVLPGSGIRCTVNGTGTKVLVSWIDTGTPSKIWAISINVAASPIIIPSTATNLYADNAVAYLYHDTTAGTGDDFILSYRQAGAPDQLRVVRLTSAPDTAISNFTTAASVLIANSPTGWSVLRTHASSLFVNWYDGATSSWTYAVRDPVTLAAVLAPTAWAAVINSANTRTAMSISALGGTRALVMGSSNTGAADVTRKLSWALVNSAGTIVGPFAKRNASLASKPWRQPGGHYHDVWVAACRDGHEQHYSLLSVPEISDSSPTIVSDAVINGAVLPASVNPTAATAAGVPVSSPVDADSHYHSMLAARSYAPGGEGSAVRELDVNYAHAGRFRSVEYCGSTYLTGSCVTQWDGHRLHEVGVAQKPEIHTATRSAAADGVWPNTGVVSYVLVFEAFDYTGRRILSVASDPITTTIVAVTDNVTLEFEPLSMTRRIWSALDSRAGPKVVCSLYRTEPNAITLVRLKAYGAYPSSLLSNPNGLAVMTYVDKGATPASNEVLYTQGGELDNDFIYGGATAIAVYKDRLWVGGGADPEIIWYSKPAVDDRPAEFSVGQQFRVPGQSIVALESMDDLLAVLCERGLYGIQGEGPDPRGLDGAFPTPYLLDSEVGCIGPRSTVVAPPGIFFQSSKGIQLLDRSRSVKYVGGPVESTLASFPVVKDAICIPAKGQVRFSVAESETAANGRVLVYDYIEDKWAVWNYAAGGQPWAGMTTWNTPLSVPREVAMVTAGCVLYEEVSNSWVDRDSTAHRYFMSIETGWLRFGRLSGYKRVRQFHPIIQRLGRHGLTISMKFHDDEATAATSRSWTDPEINALAAYEHLRLYVPQPKQTSPSIKVKLAETETGDTEANRDSEGFAVQGFSFEVGQLPGLKRLPAANTR